MGQTAGLGGSTDRRLPIQTAAVPGAGRVVFVFARLRDHRRAVEQRDWFRVPGVLDDRHDADAPAVAGVHRGRARGHAQVAHVLARVHRHYGRGTPLRVRAPVRTVLSAVQNAVPHLVFRAHQEQRRGVTAQKHKPVYRDVLQIRLT